MSGKKDKYMHKLLLIAVLAALIGAPLRADLMDQVTMDTSSLETLGGTWTLDFQLIQGQSLSNTITISGITLGGGTYDTGSESLTPGASGTFPSYTLADTGFTEVTANFTAGSQVQFDIDYTNNFDGTDDFEGFPPSADTFSWAVENSDGSIVSSFLGAGLVILMDGTDNVSTFAADDAFGDIIPNVTPIVPSGGGTVPEPGGEAAAVAGLMFAAVAYRRLHA
jgi:hypothetical protein